MRGKKGAAHFEMIISFVFFMGFIFFLFLVLKPYDSSTLSSAMVLGLYDSFEDMVFIDLTSVFLKANNTEGGDCLSIELTDNIFTYGFDDTLVTDVEGNIKSSKMQNGDLSIEGDSIFYNVLMSQEFESDEVSGCNSLPDYELGSLIERRVASYKFLINMADKYASDYNGLRDELDVPAVFDFAIVSEDLPELDMEILIPSSGDVLARDYLVEVLNSTGYITNAKFTLKIW